MQIKLNLNSIRYTYGKLETIKSTYLKVKKGFIFFNKIENQLYKKEIIDSQNVIVLDFTFLDTIGPFEIYVNGVKFSYCEKFEFISDVKIDIPSDQKLKGLNVLEAYNRFNYPMPYIIETGLVQIRSLHNKMGYAFIIKIDELDCDDISVHVKHKDHVDIYSDF